MVACPTCGKDLTYIAQYDRYYCYAEKKYAPKGLAPPTSPVTPSTPAGPSAAPSSGASSTPAASASSAPPRQGSGAREESHTGHYHCPTCGQELTYLAGYDRYYCYAEEKYAPRGIEPVGGKGAGPAASAPVVEKSGAEETGVAESTRSAEPAQEKPTQENPQPSPTPEAVSPIRELTPAQAPESVQREVRVVEARAVTAPAEEAGQPPKEKPQESKGPITHKEVLSARRSQLVEWLKEYGENTKGDRETLQKRLLRHIDSLTTVREVEASTETATGTSAQPAAEQRPPPSEPQIRPEPISGVSVPEELPTSGPPAVESKRAAELPSAGKPRESLETPSSQEPLRKGEPSAAIFADTVIREAEEKRESTEAPSAAKAQSPATAAPGAPAQAMKDTSQPSRVGGSGPTTKEQHPTNAMPTASSPAVVSKGGAEPTVLTLDDLLEASVAPKKTPAPEVAREERPREEARGEPVGKTPPSPAAATGAMPVAPVSPQPTATPQTPAKFTPATAPSTQSVLEVKVEKALPCPNCGKELTYIAKYDRLYCYSCERYAPKGYGAPPPAAPAPVAEAPKPAVTVQPPIIAPPKAAPIKVVDSKVPFPCPTCGRGLRYVRQYDRFWCEAERKYAPKEYGRAKPSCPTCGKDLTWITEYRRWYCTAEATYAPKTIPGPSAEFRALAAARPAAPTTAPTAAVQQVRVEVPSAVSEQRVVAVEKAKHEHAPPSAGIAVSAVGLVVYVLGHIIFLLALFQIWALVPDLTVLLGITDIVKLIGIALIFTGVVVGLWSLRKR